MNTTTATQFPLCLGINKEEENILIKKISALSREVLLDGVDNSGIAQKMKETFSYNEIVYLASIFVMRETAEMVSKDPMIIKVLKLVKMMQDLNNPSSNEGFV